MPETEKVLTLTPFPELINSTKTTLGFVEQYLKQGPQQYESLVANFRVMEERLETTWFSIESHPVVGKKLWKEIGKRATVRKQAADDLGRPISWEKARQPFKWNPCHVVLGSSIETDKQGIAERAEQTRTILLVLEKVVGK